MAATPTGDVLFSLDTAGFVRVLFIIVILLTLGAGVMSLQIRLSRKESKWPGLIMPIFTCSLSLCAMVTTILREGMPVHVANNVVDGFETIKLLPPGVSIAEIVEKAAAQFLLFNIPTAILLITYAVCRSGRRKKRALDKMSALDLE